MDRSRNENTEGVNVHFDDFTVTHARTNVVQSDDYYPFGLTFNSYTSGDENLYKYNGKEEQQETGWYDYGARMYMPDLGRWGVVDPLAEKYQQLAPYNYVDNNPINNTDPDGQWIKYGRYKNETKMAIRYLKKNSPSARKTIRRLQFSLRKVKIDGTFAGVGTADESKREITYTPYQAMVLKNGEVQSPAVTLLHEMEHIVDGLDGNVDRSIDPTTNQPVNEEQATDKEAVVVDELNSNLSDSTPEGKRNDYDEGTTNTVNVAFSISNDPVQKVSKKTAERIIKEEKKQ